MLDAVIRRRVPARARLAAGLVLAAVACAACGDAEPSASPGTSGTPGPGEYLPGLAATVERPRGDARAVFLLVPGGAFRAADPTGMRALGRDLAAEGYAAVTITYGHAGTQTYYPRPVEEVACGLAYAASQVPDVPVVVVGHSAGANLAMLAALRPTRTDVTCPYEPREADAVVGLAGVYDIHRSRIGENLFGVPQDEDPEAWRDGNPLTWSAERPDVPVLLVHGLADELTPVFFTEDMAAALEEGGHDVTTLYPRDALHNDLFRSEWILDDLVGWTEEKVLADDA
jgi:acetyl esterase/lipase